MNKDGFNRGTYCALYTHNHVGYLELLALLLTMLTVIFSTRVDAMTLGDENLKEVLRNVNLRRLPSTESEVVTVLPGGFVVAVEIDPDNPDWYKIDDFPGTSQRGYAHKDYLADPNTSYEITQTRNKHHVVLEFNPTKNRIAINPQSHARIYSKNGQFLSHLPRMIDLEKISNVTQVYPREITSELPYYQLTYYTGGAHCCFYNRFISKQPFGTTVVDVDTRIEEIFFDEDQNNIEITVWDETYTYWAYSYADSPILKVVLGLKDGQLDVDANSMRRTPPSDEEFQLLLSEQHEIWDESTSSVSSSAVGRLTGVMLELIYSGNSTVAFSYLNSVWPESLILKSSDRINGSITSRN